MSSYLKSREYEVNLQSVILLHCQTKIFHKAVDSLATTFSYTLSYLALSVVGFFLMLTTKWTNRT